MMNLLKKLFKKKETEEEDKYKVAIWAAIDGPFQDEDGVWTLLVKAEVDGSLLVTELYFENFDMAYNFETALQKTTGPIEIELPHHVKVAESERTWVKQQ